MRVLYLCHRIPYPPDKGDKIRAYRQLRAIAERHEVDLFTLADRSEDLQGEAVLQRCCRKLTVAELCPFHARVQMLSAFPNSKPLSLAYFHSPQLHLEVQNALLRRSYDRIFVYCSSMAQYIRGIRDVAALLDFVDIDSDKWAQYARFARFPMSAIYRREARLLRDYERKLCRRYPALIVSTEREARLARSIWERVPVHVVTNGVDTDYFAPGVAATEPTGPAIVFTGDMAYFPNEEAVTFFALKVLPLIRKTVPGARFLIVGRNPGRSVARLGKLDGITVTGSVPDIRPYLSQAQVSVAPFSVATGIQNKILEAMAYGLPVVATPRAVQGLVGTVAEMIDVGDTPQHVAELVVHLLRDAEFARQKGMEGRHRVSAEYNWDTSLGRLLSLLETPISVHRRNALATAERPCFEAP